MIIYLWTWRVVEKSAAGEARAAEPAQMRMMVMITQVLPVLGARGLGWGHQYRDEESEEYIHINRIYICKVAAISSKVFNFLLYWSLLWRQVHLFIHLLYLIYSPWQLPSSGQCWLPAVWRLNKRHWDKIRSCWGCSTRSQISSTWVINKSVRSERAEDDWICMK